MARALLIPSLGKKIILGGSDFLVLGCAALFALTALDTGAREPWMSGVLAVLMAGLGLPLLAHQGLYRIVMRFVGAEVLGPVLRGQGC